MPGTPGRESTDSGFVSEDSDGGDDSQDFKSKPNQMLFVLSAPDQAALSRIGAAQAKYLQSRIEANTSTADDMFKDLAYTYSDRRTTFQWRRAIVAESAADLCCPPRRRIQAYTRR